MKLGVAAEGMSACLPLLADPDRDACAATAGLSVISLTLSADSLLGTACSEHHELWRRLERLAAPHGRST